MLQIVHRRLSVAGICFKSRSLKLQSLEQRRLCADLVWGYKILFGIVDVQPGEYFEFNVRPSRGHQHKLYKKRNVSCERSTFFSERLVNVWNSLPDSTILVYFLGLGALFNQSVLSNFLNVLVS